MSEEKTTKKIDLSRPTGTRDFLPDDMRKHRHVEKIVRKLLESLGFEEIMTPMFEFFDLFLVRSGEKFREDVFTFTAPKYQAGGENKDISPEDARTFVLRPEFTAPVCRFYIQSDLNTMPKPLKIFYVGPVFRYDKPAPGRYREFFQFGVEMFGIQGAIADAEVMCVAASIIKKLGIKDYVLRVNDLNILRELLLDNDVNEEIQDKIIGMMDKANGDMIKFRLGLLDDETPESIENRFVDDLHDLDLVEGLITILHQFLYLNGNYTDILPKAKELLEGNKRAVQALESSNLLEVEPLLEAAGITSRVIDLSLARGLDYYTGLVFEIDSPSLGKQKQICGGGRYDHLIHEFGGDETPATGFAFGLDRLVLAAEANGALVQDTGMARADVYLYAFTPELVVETFKVQERLVDEGFHVELNVTEWGVKRALQFASKLGFHFAMLLGKEFRDGNIVLKDLKTEQQQILTLDEAIDAMKQALTAPPP
ncbi:MAG TPA: histidine--tRNA ligase [Candidatus Lokiarchaeia archaeon]|nr:histidine--tRNA ligase [Candidatus Lokiarchaeia archaeon]